MMIQNGTNDELLFVKEFYKLQEFNQEYICKLMGLDDEINIIKLRNRRKKIEKIQEKLK